MLLWAALIVALTATTGAVEARTFKGVAFDDECLIQGTSCALQGVGTREKFFFDIYHAALYLAQPSTDAGQVVSTAAPKRLVLHVVYKQVDADKWVEGWREGFAKNVRQPDPELRRKMERFIACFDEPVRRGERVVLTYAPQEGTQIVIKGQLKETIEGDDFMRALWSIWFGPAPVSKDLKEALLGR